MTIAMTMAGKVVISKVFFRMETMIAKYQMLAITMAILGKFSSGEEMSSGELISKTGKTTTKTSAEQPYSAVADCNQRSDLLNNLSNIFNPSPMSNIWVTDIIRALSPPIR